MERIYQKIGRIREYLSLIEGIKEECVSRFATDPIYRGALLHYLYMMADSSISLAEMVIRHKKLRVPQSYQEVFDILGENRVLEPGFSFSFAKIAGFRNFLAHDYEKIDTAFICEDILSKLGDVKRFLGEIEASLLKDSQ
jgi:uncharacterized protein YutE (UPF0331/DUF86 family)